MTDILFLIDTLHGGGAEKVLCTLVNHMDTSRFRITVQTEDQIDSHACLRPDIRYRSMCHCKTYWGKKLFHIWLRLCAQFKWVYPLYIWDHYDIEVAYLECGPTKFLSQSSNRDALHLAWVHCSLTEKEGIAAQAEKLQKQYGAYDMAVCVSEKVKQSFQTLIGETPKSTVVYNACDETEIRRKALCTPPAPVAGLRLVSIGRLTQQKGYDRLLDACHLLRQDGASFTLQILGEGAERPALETQIARYGLSDCVQLLGFQENPYPYLSAADVVACSSRYEGFSTVVTEALILGKCIVTTDCSGMDELLGDSEYGLITENSTQGLYEGLKKLLSSQSLRQTYAQKALARGEDFSLTSRVRQTEDFLLNALKEKQNPEKT